MPDTCMKIIFSASGSIQLKYLFLSKHYRPSKDKTMRFYSLNAVFHSIKQNSVYK
jgi:hypothetical protein